MAEQKQADFKMEIGVNFDGTAQARFNFNGNSVTSNYELTDNGIIKGLGKSYVLEDALEELSNYGYENTAGAIEEVISAMNSILFEIGE